MKNKNFLEKILNPAIDVLPILALTALYIIIPPYPALLISILLYFFMFLLYLPNFKTSPPYMLIVVGVVFCIFIFFIKATPLKNMRPYAVPVFFEIIFLTVTWIINFVKPYVKVRIQESKAAEQSTQLDEFFLVVKMYRKIILFHLIVISLYRILPIELQTQAIDNFMFFKLILILAFFVIVYEYIRWSILRKKIDMENWLPVVDKAGKVIGKVAFSVSKTSNKTYMHPVVRIATLYKGLLYLKKRPSHYLISPDKVDSPFEEYVKLNCTLDETVNELLLKNTGLTNLNPRFVFRYLFENKTSNNLVFQQLGLPLYYQHSR